VHVMAPIDPDFTHKEIHAYSIDLAKEIAARAPDKYTIEAGPKRRIGKLFIDHLRNGRGFTAVGAYSPRARKGLPVAMPTTWGEFVGGLLPNAYRIGQALSAGRSVKAQGRLSGAAGRRAQDSR
jgi:bifunctional non-homologous end joining protein LigD